MGNAESPGRWEPADPDAVVVAKQIRELQLKVDAQQGQIINMFKEKEEWLKERTSLIAARDRLQVKLDVRIEFTDELMTQIFKHTRGHDEER